MSHGNRPWGWTKQRGQKLMRIAANVLGAVLSVLSFVVLLNITAAQFTDWGNGVAIRMEIWCNDSHSDQLERATEEHTLECDDPEERVTVGELGELAIPFLTIFWILYFGLWLGTGGFSPRRDDDEEDDDETV